MKTIKKYNDFVFEHKTQKQMIVPNDIEQISELFHNADKDIFLVGGCVRDFLQGKTPHDYDLVTNALPEESKKILKDWNVSDEQGKNFGVLRIYTKTEPLGYELATYRIDISHGRDTKGEDQKVEIGKHLTINDDCLRRDLTINSLYYDIQKKEIIDLVGGIDDLKNNIIRCVGDPHKRFEEDRLRLLRIMRFSARMGGKIDEKTSNAIKEDNRLRGIGSKDDVSQERILDEWNKMRGNASNNLVLMKNYIDLLFEYDMIEQMFPGLNYSEVIVTSLENGILFYDLFWNNDIEKIRNVLIKLKFQNIQKSIISELLFLRELEWRWKNIEDIYKLTKYKNRLNIKNELIQSFCDHIQQCNYYSDQPIEQSWVNSYLKYCDDGFIIDGNDLIKQGFKLDEIEKEKERLEIERFKNDYL